MKSSIPIKHWAIGLMSRVFDSGQGDQSPIPGRVIPKTKKKKKKKKKEKKGT